MTNDILPSEQVGLLEVKCWSLKVQNPTWTQQQIADELGISRSYVSTLLKNSRERAIAKIDEIRQEELVYQQHVLRRMLGEALSAWERSKQNEEVITTKEFRDDETGDLGTASVTTREKGQAGDPRLLDQALKILESTRELLGMQKQTVEINVHWIREIRHMLLKGEITASDVVEELGSEFYHRLAITDGQAGTGDGET